jgi:hypothetical protein
MPWLLLAFVFGGGWLLVSRSAAERSPSGEPWPVGVSSASAHDAVLFALAHETDAGKLRAFAAQLAPFDAQTASTLNLRAAVLEAPAGSPLGQYVPNQAAPQTAAPTFSTAPLTRRL